MRTEWLRDLWPFVLTAEARSFSIAARRLGVAPSSVSRAVSRLEASTGVPLLVRTSRSVSLTPEGELFLDEGRSALRRLDAVRSSLLDATARPRGLLRVSLPLALGRSLLVPRIPAWLRKHPDLRLDVRFTDRFVDLSQDGIEVAVRVGVLADSSLKALRVGQSRFTTVAAPGYLAKHGAPRSPEALSRHRTLMFVLPDGTLRRWRFHRGARGEPSVVELEPWVTSDHGETLVSLATGELGIAHVPDYLVRNHLAEGRLVELFRGTSAGHADIFCVRPAGGPPSARARTFIDFVRQAVTALPDRDLRQQKEQRAR